MNKKVLRWNFVFQYGWVITNVINSILLFPIYISHIDKDTLGLWVATSSILGWMTLADPGVGEVLQQNIAEMRGKRMKAEEELQYLPDEMVKEDFITKLVTDNTAVNEEIGKSIGSGFIASSIILLLSVVVGLICFFSVGTLINKNISDFQNLSLALLITIISTGMSLVSFTVSGINQGMHNSAHVAIASLTANFLFLIVNLLFLYLDYGVMSIALANLARALYINVFNFASLLRLLKKENIKVLYENTHFKRFIRIFSFTSTAKIITGLAGGIDMLVLARYIPPASIMLYELNKRPINQSNSLIGRHSVALMPLVSHAKGTGDKPFIVNLIHKQFKLYVYFTLFVAFMFIINYKDLLILWAGDNTFLGYTILLLLTAYFITGLIGYFMSNMNYALGDIKTNSKFNIIKNIIYGILMFFAAKSYGIIGTLVVALGLCVFGDFLYFGYRIFKHGYIDGQLMKQSIIKWAVTAVLSSLATVGCMLLLNKILPAQMHLIRILLGSTLFTVFYLTLLLVGDKDVFALAMGVKNKMLYNPVTQRIRTTFFMKREMPNRDM